jgi:hypothetical protein
MTGVWVLGDAFSNGAGGKINIEKDRLQTA